MSLPPTAAIFHMKCALGRRRHLHANHCCGCTTFRGKPHFAPHAQCSQRPVHRIWKDACLIHRRSHYIHTHEVLASVWSRSRCRSYLIAASTMASSRRLFVVELALPPLPNDCCSSPAPLKRLFTMRQKLAPLKERKSKGEKREGEMRAVRGKR